MTFETMNCSSTLYLMILKLQNSIENTNDEKPHTWYYSVKHIHDEGCA